MRGFDTCGCVVLYEFDADLEADQRVHTPLSKHTTPQGVSFTPMWCKAHAHLTDAAEHYATVIEENQRKNNTLGLIGAEFPELVEQDWKLSSKGVPEVVDSRVNEALVKWQFDENRNLVIDVPTLAASEKQRLNDLTADTVSVT